jgi:2-oxoglutarate dehydrogenase E2 component (dihydrolipoamide succinyltransferase)
MPHNVLIPAVGESITEGTIARLLVAEGALVTEATPLFELETDKISAEVQAGASGAVHFRAKEGDVLPVGGVVAEIDTSKAPATPVPASTAKPSEPTANVAAKDGDKPLSPAVRKLVADAKLDPERIGGSGKGGRITKGDVLAAEQGAAALPAQPAAPASAPRAEPAQGARQQAPAKAEPRGGAVRKRLTPLRARIAQRLVQAQHTAAILTTFNEIDMSACMDMRKRFKEEFEKKLGVSLGFMSFFTAAAVQALQRYPMVNSQIDGTDLVTFDHMNIGVAVGTERGLVVPVLRNAERLSFAEIEREIKAFALKAREGKLTLEDMQEGTFTITNGGVYGSLMSTPIINPPQSGILGMHAIKPRPVAIDGQVVVRPMMYVALSYDHRLVDGADAVGFLVRIKELIEAPERMVLGL